MPDREERGAVLRLNAVLVWPGSGFPSERDTLPRCIELALGSRGARVSESPQLAGLRLEGLDDTAHAANLYAPLRVAVSQSHPVARNCVHETARLCASGRVYA